MKTCAGCGKSNPPARKACAECGATFAKSGIVYGTKLDEKLKTGIVKELDKIRLHPLKARLGK